MGFQLTKSAFEDLKKALDGALFDAVVDLTAQIKNHLVPRSENQPTPKNPEAPVTGNLKDATTREKSWEMRYRIGIDASRSHTVGKKKIRKVKPVDYGEHLEFGTKYMQPRSFLRRGSIEFKERFFQIVKKGFFRRFGRK